MTEQQFHSFALHFHTWDELYIFILAGDLKLLGGLPAQPTKHAWHGHGLGPAPGMDPGRHPRVPGSLPAPAVPLGPSRCLKGGFLTVGCCLVRPFCTHFFFESPLIIFCIAMVQSTRQAEYDNYACSEKQSQRTWFMSGNIIDFCFFTEIMGTLHREFITRNILPYWHMKGARLLLQQYFIDFVIRHSVR